MWDHESGEGGEEAAADSEGVKGTEADGGGVGRRGSHRATALALAVWQEEEEWGRGQREQGDVGGGAGGWGEAHTIGKGWCGREAGAGCAARGGGESGMGQGSVVAMCTGWLGLWPLDGGFLSAAAAAAASRPPSRDHSAAREGGHEHGDEAHEPRVWMRDLGPSGIAAVNN